MDLNTPKPMDRELASRNLKPDEEVAKKRDAAKIAEIRTSLRLGLASESSATQKYLQEYLELEKKDAERIDLLKACDLPDNYKPQLQELSDKRLDDVTIAVVPDDLWMKGSQPSESSAEKKLILVKESYFEVQKNPDEIAWLLHELAHCQSFLDSENGEAYQKNMQRFAFEDLKSEYPYPNNPVEQFTFTKQFQYLKKQGKNRRDVLAILSKYYHQEDFPFFNRLLDSVYS